MSLKKVAIIFGVVVFLTIIIVLEMSTNVFSKFVRGIPKEWNRELGIIVTEEKVKIPLPKGFKNAKVTNKIDEGIVIEDKLGNQFVWVPTKDVGFERDTLGLESTPLGYRVILVDESEKDIEWKEIVNPELITTRGGVWQPEEKIYTELLVSVEKYKGFYMGRYEATYSSGDSIENYVPGSKVSTSALVEDVKNESGQLWNFVSANESYEIAQNMYKENTTIVSHLPYGVEYDTVMKWLIETKDKTKDEIITNSSSWGNTATDTFSNTLELINTGQFQETKANNIYDLAGNVFEWSREYFGRTGHTIIRGNHFTAYKGELFHATSAGSRTWITGGGNDQKFRVMGFRVALYIK